MYMYMYVHKYYAERSEKLKREKRGERGGEKKGDRGRTEEYIPTCFING